MNKLIETLQQEKGFLEEQIVKLNKLLADQPEGFVRVSASDKRTQFYYYSGVNDQRNGKYMPKSEEERAKKIIVKEYHQKCKEVCVNRLKGVERMLKCAHSNDLNDVYTKMAEGKKPFITQIILDDEKYIEAWQAVEYEGKDFFDDIPEIRTDRGERVRSKSEKIIADKLYKYGIPYRYEYPIRIKGLGKFYPDFTILDVKNRKEILLEHLGMMDNEEYLAKALNKISTYEKNGIVLGRDLILTYETSREPFDGRMFDRALINYGLL